MTVKQLAERDGCQCGICKMLVDMSLHHPHPASPSVDHIVPRAGGGTDRPVNLQLTHLGCNSRKTFMPAPKGMTSLIVEDVVAFEVAMIRHRTGAHQGGVNGGKRCVELHGNPGTLEGRIKGGCAGGRVTGAKNFSYEDRLRGAKSQPREAKVLGGRIGGCNASHEDKVRAGKIGGTLANHVRWHVRRRIINPNCSLCVLAESVQKDFAPIVAWPVVVPTITAAVATDTSRGG